MCGFFSSRHWNLRMKIKTRGKYFRVFNPHSKKMRGFLAEWNLNCEREKNHVKGK